MSYCTILDIRALNPKREYTGESKPTITQVNTIIDQVAAEIDILLSAKGYESPATTPDAWVNFLKAVNAYGAAALAEMGMFPETSETGSTPHWKVLETKYNTWLEYIKAGDITPSTVSGDNIGSYYTSGDVDTDEYPDPVFRISSDDLEF